MRERPKPSHDGLRQSAAGNPQEVREDLALPGMPRKKVLAAVVHLLEATLIRVGSDEYAGRNKS